MIIVDITGLEQFYDLQRLFSVPMFKSYILDVIEAELTRLMWIIQNDPNIPKEYKMSVLVVRNDETGFVGLGVFISKEMKWLRFGRVLKYKEYRCPVRKYFGGELTPAYTGPDYIKELWEKEKDKIISIIKQSIITYFKR